MNSKRKNLIAIIATICVLGLLPLFLSQMRPIEVDVPHIRQEDLEVKQEQQQKEAQAAAVKTKVRRMFRCETDDDCIIVDKDPCGCLIGPSGVVAINAMYTLEFNQLNTGVMTKACPETAPSTEKECSDTAQAVCQANVCKIVY